MAFVEYIVKDGDRWDTIAYKAYGDANKINGIIEANKSTVISPILVAGTRLIIPIEEQAEIELAADLMPPWKQ